jgi:alkyl sulfatase BDS1-like metallo-beta-lactamase superfamily hydrolase
MARVLTLEREEKKQQVIILHKMGWAQEEIGKMVGIPQQTISYWLSHDVKTASMAKAQAILCHSMGWEDEKIAEAVGVSPSIVKRWVSTVANIGKDAIVTNNSKQGDGCA